MPHTSSDLLRLAAWAALAALLLLTAPAVSADERLQVVTTTTDLRELAREVGGDRVEVTCLTKGPENPHYLEARPSMVRACANADLLVVTGLELEIGYESILLGDSRNARIQKGAKGYVDASVGIVTLEVPRGPVDRSMGDVHVFGNPHFLQDPVRAKKAAKTIADALARVDIDHARDYAARLKEFERRVDTALFGGKLIGKVSVRRLERALRDGRLIEYLERKELASELGGLAARMAPFAGRKVVSYHGLWVYLLDRFHLVEAAKLEPKPGIAPSPRHLAQVVKTIERDKAGAVLFGVHQDEKNVRFVTGKTQAVAVKLAHAPDALPGTSGYLAMLEYNVDQLARALGRERDR